MKYNFEVDELYKWDWAPAHKFRFIGYSEPENVYVFLRIYSDGNVRAESFAEPSDFLREIKKIADPIQFWTIIHTKLPASKYSTREEAEKDMRRLAVYYDISLHELRVIKLVEVIDE